MKMELKIPPVVVFFVCLASMFGIYYLLPDFSHDFIYRKTVSRVFLALGALAGITGIVAFRQHQTTVDPTNPDKASHLVTTGIYRYTRNPMYVGMLFVLIGGALRIGNPVCLLSLILYVAYMTRFQIMPEERALQKQFGPKYKEYQEQVRRWV